MFLRSIDPDVRCVFEDMDAADLRGAFKDLGATDHFVHYVLRLDSDAQLGWLNRLFFHRIAMHDRRIALLKARHGLPYDPALVPLKPQRQAWAPMLLFAGLAVVNAIDWWNHVVR
jgi:hypothetical protein